MLNNCGRMMQRLRSKVVIKKAIEERVGNRKGGRIPVKPDELIFPGKAEDNSPRRPSDRKKSFVAQNRSAAHATSTSPLSTARTFSSSAARGRIEDCLRRGAQS